MKVTPLSERFWAKVDKTSGCWLWTASLDRRGYGQINSGRVDGKVTMRRAHRIAWELTGLQLVAGFELDHLCRNPLCVRPDHLEQVTHAENVRRGRAGYHKGNVREMCRRNLHKLADSKPRPNGTRYCRQCQSTLDRERYRLAAA